MRKMEGNAGEQVIRVASAVGNGAHVFVPREWLGEKIAVVRLEPKQNPEELILEKLGKYLKNIVGLYLVGSHARGEATAESDIDVLAITNKELGINNLKNMHIIAIPEDKIDSAVSGTPVLLYSMLQEAKPIINSRLLDELREKYKPKKSDFKEYLKETRKIMDLNEKLLLAEDNPYKLNDDAYSIVLRLRGIYLVKSILEGIKYNNRWVKDSILKELDVDYDSIYSAYSSVKEDQKKKISLNPEDLKKLISFIQNKLKELYK